jgi:hypothetical protein
MFFFSRVFCVVLLSSVLLPAAETKPVADAGGVWQVAVPAEWKVQPNGPMTMVSSPDGRANVVIFAEDRRSITVDQWFESISTDLRKQLPNFKLTGKQALPVAGREGLLARTESEPQQGVQMHADYVLVQGTKQQLMLSCNGPRADFKANQLTFGQIIASLRLPGEPVAVIPDADSTQDRRRSPDAATGMVRTPDVNPPAAVGQTQWEPYVSKHFTFTLRKPVGWVVEEGFQADPTLWAFSVTHPEGLYQVSQVHGTSPAGQDAEAMLRGILADYRKKTKAVQLAPTIRTKIAGKKTIYLFEGASTNHQDQKRQFRTLVSVGDGLFLNQRIEAPEGQLEKAAPVMLQTLANLRVAKNVFNFDEGGRAAQAAQANRPEPPKVALVPRKLANGWGAYSAPANWKQVDLGKGLVIACDPAEQAFFVVASTNFVTPQYNLVRVPGVLVSKFLPPHEAMAFACTQQGHGKDFQFKVQERKDLVEKMRAGMTGGRPCSVEDFVYSFDKKGKAYKGLSLGHTVGNYMDSSWSFGHMTIWAPADQFDVLIPTLGRIMTSYELNGEKVGEYIAEGIRRYQAGIAQLSRTLAANSEQMRRENYELHMERGRVQDYTSYLTTRMIMGEWDYLAGASGYVRGDASGLYTADGNRITSEPYGESLTRGMQEINSRPLFEAVRP